MSDSITKDEYLVALRGMWGELKAVRSSIDTQVGSLRAELSQQIGETNQRLDVTNQNLEALRYEVNGKMKTLSHQVLESETRLATATLQLTTDVRDLSGLIRDWRQEHREDRESLRARIDRLERHAGITH